MNTNKTDSLIKELTQQSRNIDLLSTIFEKLYNRYRFWAGFLDLILLLASILLCLTTFVDQKILEYLKIAPEKGQIILGICSLLVFGIAILSFTIHWKEKAMSYGQAEEVVSKLRLECHELLKMDNHNNEELAAKYLEYFSIINNLPKIPEKDFHKLKAYHKRRQELSRMLDLYPGSSVKLLKVFIVFRSNLHALLRKPFLNNTVTEDL